MGSCLTKSKTTAQKAINKQQIETKRVLNEKPGTKNIQKYGIINSQQEKSVYFNHSPLRYSDFLFSKFKRSDSTPEQVALGFMLSKCQIDKEKGQISLQIINSSPTKVWVVYGGTQRVSETGLTVQINHYSQLKQYLKEKSSLSTLNGDKLPPFSFQSSLSEQILIILEPLLDKNQTIFMVYRYQISHNEHEYTLVTQTLQWNSLSFRINDIYGSQYLFRVNDQNETCSVCLMNKSECILLPCRHMCICSICLEQIEKIKPQCPLCRKEYYSFVKYIQKEESESIMLE